MLRTIATGLGDDDSTIGILGRAFWMGLAALAAIVVTTGLGYEANRWEEEAVLGARERARLGGEALALVLRRADGARGYLVAPDSELAHADRGLSVALAATLDSLTPESGSIPEERAVVAALRVEIAQWDTTFVHAAFAPHEAPAIPRLLLGASGYLFEDIQKRFSALRAVHENAFALALRKDDILRAGSFVSILMEVSMILGALHWLRRRLRHGAARLSRAQIEILDRLTLAAEVRDNDAAGHTQRVAKMSERVAQAIGLDDATVESIRRAAPLHDIGKIGIPDEILYKPGTLNDAEQEAMRAHAAIGARILSRGQSNVVQMAERIARSHHEKWDGTGYPEGLRGAAIPIEARIVAVADVFDALSSERPYHKAAKLSDVLDEIRRLKGSHFDPAIADAFLNRDCYEGHGTAGGEPRRVARESNKMRAASNLAPARL